jgi:carbon monoxide dehydrogenase subunit G
MARIRLEIEIEAPPDAVWAELSDLSSHAQWMADADTIDFVTDQKQGVGTAMRVPTRLGPFRTDDLMTVTGWVEGESISVAHRGLVSGEGRFEIVGRGDGADLIWTENLRFPWWLGGPITTIAAGPVLKWIWRGNLKRFRERVTPASGL